MRPAVPCAAAGTLAAVNDPLSAAAPPGAVDPAFWRDCRVLLTGHTGFKGAWLSLWLQAMGARVTGFSAPGAVSEPSLFALAGVADGLEADLRGDIRDPAAVAEAVYAAGAEVVLHLAAQPMVRRSFVAPLETYETNVMGTANVLEAVRVAGVGTVQAVVNVTSDKCYDNSDGRPPRAFVEGDPMGGHDPYSSSKGAAELVTDGYRRSFFSGTGAAGDVRVASARAGNVIGGGDWGEDRLVPDIVRAAAAGAAVPIRRPDAVRPWQHVLNPLSGYLLVAQALMGPQRDAAARGWNFGPSPDDVRPVSFLVEELSARWPAPLRWDVDPGPHPHEAGYLALDSSAARTSLGWTPGWGLTAALDAIVEWHAAVDGGSAGARETTLAQIGRFSAAAT
ncbi:MAG: rfbG [Solirubrobacterales bacterium]|nr:rfbG [Solirubrobacterales bacterium]